ncbi:hypothetical protein GCM10010331_49820 [Streptomyces xanthochromogenes]|uniref:hypothetical protein n=1 Tax=Streptomyces xanthochromogenes TaxID=67384 RepID=UPI0016757B2F|nr:hypothetical protein [Streptomyces xanthochromogenes]GHB55978.1 hypothetical protein GCM10010331_49820 [Streptomyces xanthochromogenes]
MTRFLAGLLLSAAAFVIVWAFTHSPQWSLIAGIATAALVWFGEFILDDLL